MYITYHYTNLQMSVRHVESVTEFDTTILSTSGNQYFLVDFYADWCGPCKRIAPTLDKFAKTYSTVTFLKVNVDELGDISQRYDVRAMPTFLVFKAGNSTPAYQPVVGADVTKIENLLKLVTGVTKPSENF